MENAPHTTQVRLPDGSTVEETTDSIDELMAFGREQNLQQEEQIKRGQIARLLGAQASTN